MKKPLELFEEKFEKTDGCWDWIASKNRDGCGQFKLYGRATLAHRAAYQLYVGDITNNLHVLHHCDNPSCVNPSHLFLGTSADNMRDRENKGRGADRSGEKNGYAKLTEKQVRVIRSRRGEGERGIDLSREFGVAQKTICDICHRRKWAKLL